MDGGGGGHKRCPDKRLNNNRLSKLEDFVWGATFVLAIWEAKV